VQYENIEHGGFDRFLRAALVTACSYSALAVGFVLISLATAMRYNLPTKVRLEYKPWMWLNCSAPSSSFAAVQHQKSRYFSMLCMQQCATWFAQ
jgi:hypothetical protein